MNRVKGYLFIACAATLWGASATLVKYLFNAQFHPLIIIQTRVSIAFVLLFFYFITTNPRILKFRIRDVPLFFFVGVCGIAGSNYFYYFAIKESNVATAIVVQYSAPIMVALYAIVVQHERMTRFKLLALIFSSLGIFLAVGGLNGLLAANGKGILFALVAAVSYAIFNIAGKPLIEKYTVWPSLVFSLGAATFFWMVIQTPQTILAAHVIVKLLLTAASLALMLLAGKRYYPAHVDVPVLGFSIALLISTWSILSIGFVIASIVPTARFAQPIGAVILYPMVALSGLFFPVEALPPALRMAARVLPLTYAVSLLQGIWKGDAWSAHAGDVAALVVVFAVCTALSAKVFRWE